MIVSSDNGTPEIFYTLQGEGTSCGRPAIFLRLSNCNLSCVWCDTPYTWNFEKVQSDHPEKYVKKEQQIELSLQQIHDAINSYPDHAILVITGGEPLLQQDQIIKLIYGEDLNVDKIEIETNGTIVPDVELFDRVQFNVSLKLSNAGMTKDKRLRNKAIEAYVEANSIFKFVVDTSEDLEEIKTIIDEYEIDHSRVWLMPQGRAVDELNSKLEWLADICIKNGFNLTNRLHVQTWGAKRGV
jgi:7-carboxy-7-deazaguanine synthase